MRPSGEGLAFLASTMPMISSSVDRLEQVPARLGFLFGFSAEEALSSDEIRAEMRGEGTRAVVCALAEELASSPRLDRERFRAAANRVKERTGQKGRALFIRSESH